MQGVKKALVKKKPMNRMVDAAIDSKEPGIKTIFSVIAKTGNDDGFKPKRKPKPTKHRPGSLEKACVLRARLEAGQELWHPKDEKILATHTTASVGQGCQYAIRAS